MVTHPTHCPIALAWCWTLPPVALTPCDQRQYVWPIGNGCGMHKCWQAPLDWTGADELAPPEEQEAFQRWLREGGPMPGLDCCQEASC